MPPRILVTPRSVTREGHPSLDLLREAGCEIIFSKGGVQPGEADLRQLLPGCAGYLAGVEPITARVLAVADQLKVISRNGTGTDNVDLEAAAARGIRVLRAEGANARGVAELAIGLMFALARKIPSCHAAIKSGGWERGSAGVELEGRSIGIFGCGKVGRLTARMALGMGMKVLAYDPFPDPSFMPGGEFCYSGKAEILAFCDVISLHCPPAADGRPVIDAAAIRDMRKGTLLINTARYDLMEAESVAAALDSGAIAGLGLDVFDHEPPQNRRLVDHERTVVTPHLGGFTGESIDRAMSVAVNGLLEVLREAGLLPAPS